MRLLGRVRPIRVVEVLLRGVIEVASTRVAGLPPEVLESIGRQLGVAHRMLDIAVAKVCL
jgi:hypothetical protein